MWSGKCDYIKWCSSQRKRQETIDQKNKSNIEKIVRQTFYELNLNICNQVIYDYTYNFTKEDIEFIEKFDLYKAIQEIIQITTDDLRKYKE